MHSSNSIDDVSLDNSNNKSESFKQLRLKLELTCYKAVLLCQLTFTIDSLPAMLMIATYLAGAMIAEPCSHTRFTQAKVKTSTVMTEYTIQTPFQA